VVAPGLGGRTPRIVTTRESGVAVTHIQGSSPSGPYHDTVVTAFAAELPECELPGLRCRARDFAVRRDAGGRITYLVASGAERVEVEGMCLTVGGSGVIEWEREVVS
jgi:hypothetical protein